MLLSSTAESLYWTSRYLERAASLARVLNGYEALSLDLPRSQSAPLSALLGLVGKSPLAIGADPAWGDLVEVLVCDVDSASSVRGALNRARENLRSSRSTFPTSVWVLVNALHARARELDVSEPARVLSVLSEISAGAHQIEGELFATMTRDEAHCFWRLGCELERRDMLLRSLAVLVPLLTATGERMFDDVRWMGLLECLGARSTYRRRHHGRVTLESVLAFVLCDASFPPSLPHGVSAMARELGRLPQRPAPMRALEELAPFAEHLRTASPAALGDLLEASMAALSSVHDALHGAYFVAETGSAARAVKASAPR
jgi:uncharacterized alpha-E superfamily protein